MKSVLILYPTHFFVEEDGRSFVRPCNNYYTKALSLNPSTYRNRCRLYNTLLDQYRMEGYRVGWALFAEENNPVCPDISSFSSIFTQCESDYLVNVGITELQHLKEFCYPDEKAVIQTITQQIGSIEELVVGGFHYSDCVVRFARAAQYQSIQSKVDQLLTEKFFQAVEESFGQDLYLQAMLTGHLDPVMHEDNPFVIQEELFEGRIGPILKKEGWVPAREDLEQGNYPTAIINCLT